MLLNEKFNVSPKKIKVLLQKIKEMGINILDIEENVSRGGGRGGQKINKTSNRIKLRHLPTGLTAVCQRERQRNINRFLALRELVDRIEMKIHPESSKKLMDAEKVKKQKDRRKRRRLKKILA